MRTRPGPAALLAHGSSAGISFESAPGDLATIPDRTSAAGAALEPSMGVATSKAK